MQEYLLGIDAGTSGVKAIVNAPAQLGRAASRRLVGRL